MSLTTEFESIDPKKVDARIDALRQEIEAQLNPIVQKLQQTRALERTTLSWYEDNTKNAVYSAANDGQTVTQQSIEQDISATSIDENDGAELSARVGKLMEKRPEFSLGAFFKGQVRNQKVTFLDDMKEKGEVLLVDARKAVERAQTSLGETRDEQWNRFEGVQGFYDDLTQAITAQDTDALLTVIQSDNAKAIPADQRRDLLLKPVNAYDTAMLAIIEMTGAEPKKEGEIIATVLNSFGSDFEALKIIQSNIPKIQSEEQRGRYQAYANAFVGTFIPVGNNAINVNMIGYATQNSVIVAGSSSSGKGYPKSLNVGYNGEAVLSALAERPNFVRLGHNTVNANMIGYADENTLVITGSSSSGKGYPKSLSVGDDGEAVLSTLAERPNFVRVGNVVVNANKVGYVNQDSIIVTGSSSSGKKGYPKSLSVGDDGESILSAFAERPNFVRIGNNVININMIGYADENTLVITGSSSSGKGYPKSLDISNDSDAVLSALDEHSNFMRVGNVIVNTNKVGYANESTLVVTGSSSSGKGYPKSLDISNDSDAVLSALAERPNFVGVGNNIVNANMIGYADQSSIIVTGSSSSGKGYPKSLSVGDDGEVVLSTLAKRANFVRVGNTVININKVGYANQSSAIVVSSSSSGKGYPKSLSVGDDGEVFKKIRQAGQRMSVIQTYAGQRNELMHGIHEARTWEHDHYSTQQDGDTLMDYLPFIIVGAIILFDDHGQADMQGLDTLGDQAGLDGVDNDFSAASAVSDMGTVLDSDFGVDSFESDLVDMDTGMDGGLDNDFDSGGGMDMDSGIDTSSDFGGGSDFGSDFGFD